ncbi:MAG: thermonuclease family protein [Hyphomicrobiales bacterium]|nr:thermonuclease family protein [Hyphomicrobiales bacterium]
MLIVTIGIAVLLNYRDLREVHGKVRVVDGDSLAVLGERVRLEGIDAPELGQTCWNEDREYACGSDARHHLADLIKGRAVLCSGARRDRFDRLLATCSIGDLNVNRQMVRDGWAVSFGGYEAEENAARSARLGLWRGKFDRPRDWREIHGDGAAGL